MSCAKKKMIKISKKKFAERCCLWPATSYILSHCIWRNVKVNKLHLAWNRDLQYNSGRLICLNDSYISSNVPFEFSTFISLIYKQIYLMCSARLRVMRYLITRLLQTLEYTTFFYYKVLSMVG